MTQLLVSVRSAAEAESAAAGGAGLIDVKEPSRGAMGKADDRTIADVVRAVAGRRPVSAAFMVCAHTCRGAGVCSYDETTRQSAPSITP